MRLVNNKPNYAEKKEVENTTDEAKKVKHKFILSAEVQEVMKEEKVDFNKLLEAVRNDKMDVNLPEDEIDDESYNNYEYEDYYDEYCDNEI